MFLNLHFKQSIRDKMLTPKDVDHIKFVRAVAEELKKNENVKPHALAGFVKSGVNAERPPEQKDFWFLRSAAILRKAYTRGPVGVSRLRTAFGSRKRRGHKPAHHAPAGGKFIRMMLQQLEKNQEASSWKGFNSGRPEIFGRGCENLQVIEWQM